jgi:hypothetical protein
LSEVPRSPLLGTEAAGVIWGLAGLFSFIASSYVPKVFIVGQGYALGKPEPLNLQQALTSTRVLGRMLNTGQNL